MRKQFNNLMSLALLAVVTISVFSTARYSERYDGLSYTDSSKSIMVQNTIVDKKLEREMEKYSDAFIEAAFSHDEKTIANMLAKGTEYVRSADGSSFIRYVSGSQLVEGYMATDRKLVKVKARWCVFEGGGNLVCGANVYIKGLKEPQRWYIHYRKAWGRWKIYMLENGI